MVSTNAKTAKRMKANNSKIREISYSKTAKIFITFVFFQWGYHAISIVSSSPLSVSGMEPGHYSDLIGDLSVDNAQKTPDYDEHDDDARGNSSLVTKTRVKRENCQCGTRRMTKPPKIIGGQPSNVWPWVAALIFNGTGQNRQFCGSSLINNRYVLTAAHCVQDVTPQRYRNIQVYLGTTMIETGFNNTEMIRTGIQSIKMHPKYDPKTLDNDIALIKLMQPVRYTKSIKPICLQQQGTPFIGRTVTVSGWGATDTSPSAQGSNNLNEVKVKVLRNGDCNKKYSSVNIPITQNMLCATLPGRDSCKGDSGGPLFIKKGEVFDQIGVVSFGQDCANPNFAGVYARVNRYLKWIKDNTKDATYCARSF